MIGSTVRQETFYYPQRAFDRDVIDVFVIRYTWGGADRPLKAEHLTPQGYFVEHDEGVCIEPALSVPGILAHLLVRTPPYDPEWANQAEQTVEQLIAKVLGGRAQTWERLISP